MESNLQQENKPARGSNENKKSTAVDDSASRKNGKTKKPLQVPLKKPSVSRKNAGTNENEKSTAVDDSASRKNGKTKKPLQLPLKKPSVSRKNAGTKENEKSTAVDDSASRKNGKTKKPLQLPLKKPSVSRKNAGTNWSNVLAALYAAEGTTTRPEDTETNNNETIAKKSRNRRKKDQRMVKVAMDCEMVGTGPMGNDDMLARVSIVNQRGKVLLDKFVKPQEAVTDYRTSVSGIRPQDIENAEEFSKVQDEVLELLQGKLLVGHAIRNDLAVLFLKHPFVNIRDTSRYKPLACLVSNGRTPSLKQLSRVILGVEIQTGEHNSVEDARAAMNIYNRLSGDWEKYIQKRKPAWP